MELRQRGRRVGTVVVAVAVLLPQAIRADEAPAKPFLVGPEPAGWVRVHDEPELGFRHLAGTHLQSADGEVDVYTSIHVLASGRQERDFPSGAIRADAWLPKGKGWSAVGPASRRCYWQGAPTKFHLSRQYRYSGQARCRGDNFVLVFNLFSKANWKRSQATWETAFKKVVVDTKTAAPCLTPEEMTFVAELEGPPLATRTIDATWVKVVLVPLCGSGGCTCLRFRKTGRCYQLVLPVEHCDAG